MTAKQIVNIFLRLKGALWVLAALISFPAMLFFASSATDVQTRKMVLGNGLGEIVWLVIGIVVFFKSEVIATALFLSPKHYRYPLPPRICRKSGSPSSRFTLGSSASRAFRSSLIS
jgi:hypothetical protein